MSGQAFTDVWGWLADGEHWSGPDGIATRLMQHVGLSAAALGVACLIALPLALWLGHIGRGGTLAVNLTNVGRAVPTFAVLVLLAIGPLGFGPRSTVTALVLFALPPLLANAYIGMRGVDRAVVEAARGMGLSEWQILRTVELPLAVPLLMTGVRLAAVQVVATATIAALVAGGGLGRIITTGFALQDQPMVVAGAVLVGLLALVVEVSLAMVERAMDPVRQARNSQARVAKSEPAVLTS